MASIRVVVADDDEDVRAALTDVLVVDPRFDVVGSCATGHEVHALVDRARADLVLLDVRMPGGGVEAARVLARHSPPVVVVAVSASTDTSSAAAMLRAGATGYLAKGHLGAQLPDLVARCAAGETVLALPHPRSVLDALLRSVGEPDPHPGSPS